MNDDKLFALSLEFAVKIIELVKTLQEKKEFIISKQIGKSGTSIGANIREAKFAISKPEFIAKMQIALKESNETSFWLELLQKTGYLNLADFKEFEKINVSIRAMLISALKTSKANA